MRLTPRRVVVFVILTLIVVVGIPVLSLLGPSTPIVVSRQTTYLTEPLDRWGRVDYVEALRRQWSEGVTPENNAAVLLWQVLGPADIPAERRSSFFAELGMPPLPLAGEYFVDIGSEDVKLRIEQWMGSRPHAATDGPLLEGMPPDPELDPSMTDYEFRARQLDAFSDFTELTEFTYYTSWEAEDFPPLIEWLSRIEVPLDVAIEASRRPKYFSPLIIQSAEPGSAGPLVTALLPDAQDARGVARALCQRAMLRLGEGDGRRAFEDLKAVHRLARLIGQQGWLIHQLVAIAIDQMALRGVASLLHEASLSAEELREIRQFLLGLSPPCNVAQSLDGFERLVTLDTFSHLARGGLGDEADLIGWSGPSLWLIKSGIDWNVPMEMANGWFDKLVAALDHPTIEGRRLALAAVDSELSAVVNGVKSPGTIVKALLSSRKRSELAGEVMLALFLPALTATQQAEDRSVTSLRLVQVAAALAIHRAERGSYPMSLDDLPPELREELPLDPFTVKPFFYERRGDGYVLWSVGRNQQDNAASGDEFCPTIQGERKTDERIRDADQDDIVLRVPWSVPVNLELQSDE